MKKIINYFVEKCWNCEEFQKAITKKIKEMPIAWCLNNLNKCITDKNGYIILHDPDKMTPWVFSQEQEIRDKVAEWDKSLAKSEEKREMVKPKRKYTKRKKETKA